MTTVTPPDKPRRGRRFVHGSAEVAEREKKVRGSKQQGPALYEPEMVERRRYSMARQRLTELTRLLTHRSGCATVPWTSDARQWAEPYADHLLAHAQAGGRAKIPNEAISLLVDRLLLLAPEAPPPDVLAIAASVVAGPRKWKAATLGDRLRLTATERKACAILTIRPAGKSGREFAAFQREEERKRKAKRRAAKKAKAGPRPKRETDGSLAKQHGVSRRTVIRWRKAGWQPDQPPPTVASPRPRAHAREADVTLFVPSIGVLISRDAKCDIDPDIAARAARLGAGRSAAPTSPSEVSPSTQGDRISDRALAAMHQRRAEATARHQGNLREIGERLRRLSETTSQAAEQFHAGIAPLMVTLAAIKIPAIAGRAAGGGGLLAPPPAAPTGGGE